MEVVMKKKSCNICGRAPLDLYIDGRTRFGTAWANMCNICFTHNGVGLGLGKGQKYRWDEGNEGYRKVAG
jgi:hypothetical protein